MVYFQISEELLCKPSKENGETILWKLKRHEFNGQSTLWKTVKPYFSEKGSNSRQIALLETDSILTDDKDIAKTVNTFLINITKDFNLKPYKDSSITNINGITSNFDNHVSIKKIKESFSNIVNTILISKRLLERMLKKK